MSYKDATYAGMSYLKALETQNKLRKDANEQMSILVKEFEALASKVKSFNSQSPYFTNTEEIGGVLSDLKEVAQGMENLIVFGATFYIPFDSEYDDTLSSCLEELREELENGAGVDFATQQELLGKLYDASTSVEAAEGSSYEWHNSNCY